MATVYNFSATQGSQLSVRLNVKDASGNALDLSGYDTRGIVKYRYSSTNTLIDLAPIIVSGNEGSGYVSGLIDVYLSGSQKVLDTMPARQQARICNSHWIKPELLQQQH